MMVSATRPASDAFEAQLLSMDPAEDCPWDNTFEPGPSIFGWTYNSDAIDFHGLDDLTTSA